MINDVDVRGINLYSAVKFCTEVKEPFTGEELALLNEEQTVKLLVLYVGYLQNNLQHPDYYVVNSALQDIEDFQFNTRLNWHTTYYQGPNQEVYLGALKGTRTHSVPLKYAKDCEAGVGIVETPLLQPMYSQTNPDRLDATHVHYLSTLGSMQNVRLFFVEQEECWHIA